MNFDYDQLKELCSDTLFNTYKSQLEVLKIKNGKNIMNSFNFINVSILKIIKENDIITIRANVKVLFLDYVIDTTNKKVIRGNSFYPLTNTYILEFVVTDNTEEQICDGCGNPIENNVSGIYPYCRKKYVVKPTKFVLSTKRKI